MIGWLRADSAETLAADYVALLGRRLELAVDGLTEQAAQVALVQQWLEETGETWLLVFDNADSLTHHDLHLCLPRRQPAAARGHVFITSRNPDWHRRGGTGVVEVLTPQEAAAFSGAGGWVWRASRKADELAAALGYLPLALEHAALMWGKGVCTLGHYHDLWVRRTGKAGVTAQAAGYHAT
ncbi:MAG: hypothetical protein R3E31_21770 [Chloroflexota bacterium]